MKQRRERFRRGDDEQADVECAVEREGRGIDDEGDVPFACPGRDTTWGCKASVGAVWRVTSGIGTTGRAVGGTETVIMKGWGERR
jgi:hypothetical protein